MAAYRPAEDEYGLIPKERAFCDYYLACGVGVDAYMDAFDVIDRKKASSAASRLLKKDNVQNYLAIVRNKVSGERIASAEEVLEFYTNIMRNDAIELPNRIICAKELAKRHGLDKKTIEATVEAVGNFEINIFDDEGEIE